MLMKNCLFIIAILISQSDAAPPTSSKNIQKKIARNQEYNEHIADIFEFPVPEIGEVYKKCTNIVCIHYTLCVDNVVLSDGTDLFELRLALRSDIDPAAKRIVCADYEMPCCADQALAKAEALAGDEIPAKPKAIDEAHVDIDYNLDYDSNESVPNCGAMNGDNLVSIYLHSPMDQLVQYIGGGSLIQPSVILTAAHIISSQIQPEMLVIRAGDHNNAKRQERSVTNIIIHEEFFVRTLINDIALIVADRPFDLTDYVNTICLPPQNIQTNAGIMCTASGWKNGYQIAALETFELPIVDRNQCENRLRQTRLGQYFILSPSFMCAGGLGFETCKGDGGSPLICEIPHLKNRFYQAGIMAGSLGCDGNHPGIYVNVAHFTDWIQQQLGFIGHNLDPVNIMPFRYFD